MENDDTIFAVSTAPGRAGIAVVRVSGPRARCAAEALAGKLPEPRHAAFRRFRDHDGDVIDSGLLLWFAAPRTETGEDMAEFHLHGSRAVIDGMLARLGGLAGLRPAGPGEFARRAFANNKLDLTAVEALADLLDAETAGQRRQALRQLDGALGRAYEGWRSDLIEARALLEAGIDFSDEDDVPAETFPEVDRRLAGIGAAMRSHLADGHRGERLREGATVVIAGPTNAGKSSLINALARRDVAIVADVPGTTRDILEARLDLGGVPVTIVDTAGVRESADEIESEGIRRARARMGDADLVLWMEEAGRPESPRPSLDGVDVWRVVNKIDLQEAPDTRTGNSFRISVVRGDGMDALIERLTTHFETRFVAGTDPLLTRARHRHGIQAAASALDAARASIAAGAAELAAESLRQACDEFGRLVGRVDVEDVLDVIFRDFCIGK